MAAETTTDRFDFLLGCNTSSCEGSAPIDKYRSDLVRTRRIFPPATNFPSREVFSRSTRSLLCRNNRSIEGESRTFRCVPTETERTPFDEQIFSENDEKLPN